jgi:hypothetical protein
VCNTDWGELLRDVLYGLHLLNSLDQILFSVKLSSILNGNQRLLSLILDIAKQKVGVRLVNLKLLNSSYYRFLYCESTLALLSSNGPLKPLL